MEQIAIQYLENRSEVLAKAADMAREAKTHLYGMGRDLSWLSDPAFREAVGAHDTVREGGALDMLIIAARKDRTAKKFAGIFYNEVKANVGFLDFGQVRVLLTDGQRVLLGFPVAPGMKEGINEVGFGLYIENQRLAEWLEKRFLIKYVRSQKLGQSILQDLLQFVRINREQVILAVALSLFFFILGRMI